MSQNYWCFVRKLFNFYRYGSFRLFETRILENQCFTCSNLHKLFRAIEIVNSCHIAFSSVKQTKNKCSLNSSELQMNRTDFFDFLSPLIDVVNLYVIDRPRFAFKVDWCLVFGGEHSLTIRDTRVRKRRR